MATLPLDEEDELYGYGIYNTDHNTLIPLVQYGVKSKGYFENDELVSSEEKAMEMLQAIAEDQEIEKKSDLSHLRVVQVRLDNQTDKQAVDELDVPEVVE